MVYNNGICQNPSINEVESFPGWHILLFVCSVTSLGIVYYIYNVYEDLQIWFHYPFLDSQTAICKF